MQFKNSNVSRVEVVEIQKALIPPKKKVHSSSIVCCCIQNDCQDMMRFWMLIFSLKLILFLNSFHLFQGVSEIRIDRKALPNALRKFTTLFNKIPQIISRGAWKNSDVPLNAVYQCRLETLISVSRKFDFKVLLIQVIFPFSLAVIQIRNF